MAKPQQADCLLLISRVNKIASTPDITVHYDGKRIDLLPSAKGTGFFYLGDPALIPWLKSYASKSPIPFPIPTIETTPFRLKVLKALAKIPFGKTLSYGELAEKIGHPRAARAVGSGCGSNPFPLIIPCHRILHAGGGLGGFTSGLEIKRRLLKHEGLL